MEILRSGLTLVAIAALLATASCAANGPAAPGSAGTSGSATEPDSTSEPQGTQPWLTPDGGTLVACGHEPAFPVTTVAEGGLEVDPETDAEIVAALADLQQLAGIDAPTPLQDAGADEVRWAVLWRDGATGEEELGMLLAPAESIGFSLVSDEIVTLARREGRLTVTSWGDQCSARPALPSARAWAAIALAEPISSDGTSVNVMVSEIDCTSARDPEPHLAAEPVVVETEADVTVYWTTEQMEGSATCPGNPWVERTIELDHPLGERELLDGSTWPPTPVTSVGARG